MNSEAKPINVLLVDDDELDIESVRRAFAKGNIHNPLWVAGNGEEALDLLRGDEYPRDRRLVLLDLNMPRMNGIELLREIRNDPSLQRLSVVVLTTSNEESDRLEAFGLNVAGYLLKPVTFQGFVELIATIDRYWTQVEMQPAAR
jgi:CheY-like chemotaxis protein